MIDLADHLAWTDVMVEAYNWRSATLRQLGREVEAAADDGARRSVGPPRAGGRSSWRSRRCAATPSCSTGTAWTRSRRRLLDPPPGAQRSPNFAEAAAAQLFLLRLAQGRVGELIAVIESFARRRSEHRSCGAPRTSLALASVGDRDAASARVARPGLVAACRTAELAVAQRRGAARRCMPRCSATATAHPRSRALRRPRGARRWWWPTASPRSARSRPPGRAALASSRSSTRSRVTRKSQACGRTAARIPTHLRPRRSPP